MEFVRRSSIYYNKDSGFAKNLNNLRRKRNCDALLRIEMSRRVKGALWRFAGALVTVKDPIAISQRKCQLKRFHSAGAARV